MKRLLFMGLFFVLGLNFLFAQTDSTQLKKLTFSGDFRFRVEQGWNSQKTNGSYRDDRFRLRYRLRFGVNYQFVQWAEFGMRIRTGYHEKQQDPHLTIGDGFNEYSSVPIGFEKLFFKLNFKKFIGWIGKNTFPFEKQNELFWSDNVNPDGAFVNFKFDTNSSFFESLELNAGHFIFGSSGKGFDYYQYFQGFQVLTTYWNNRIKLFPSFYYFNKMPNIPDGYGTFEFNYAILHLGTSVALFENPKVIAEIDYYHNVEDLSSNDSIPNNLQDQKSGIVASVGVGELKKKGDWLFRACFSYLERYAIIDYFAQNDWARWDYSNQGSPDGRLSNFKGMELNASYLIRKNFRMKIRYFIVEQLIPYGAYKETGNRIRLDLDIGF